MAGFMAGFGEAFSRQIEKGQERRHEMKRDAFQVAYDSYIRKRSEYDSALKEDERAVQAAKALTEKVRAQTGGDIPEGAWEHAYKWIQAGLTPLQVEESLRTSVFSAQETPAMSDTAQTVDPVAKPKTEAVEQQMAESGMMPQQEQTPGQQNPDILGSIFGADGAIANIREGAEQRRIEGANQEVMRAAGVDQEEFDRVMGGYTPPELSGGVQITGERPPALDLEGFNDEAVWVTGTREDGTRFRTQGMPDGKGGFVDSQSNPIPGVDPNQPGMAREEYKEYSDALKYVNDNTAELREEKVATLTMIDQGMAMVDLVNKNEKVITATSAISTTLNDLSNELASAVDQAQGIFSPELLAAEEQYVQATADQFQQLGMDSSDAHQFASMRVRFIFSLARTMSGSGPLTAADIRDAAKVLDTSDPEEFKRQMRTLMKQSAQAYDTKANVTMEMDLGVEEARQLGVNVDALFGPIKGALSPEADFFIYGTVYSNSTGEPFPEAEEEVPTEPQGEVLETDVVTEETLKQYPELGNDPNLLGKTYRLYENGIDIED